MSLTLLFFRGGGTSSTVVSSQLISVREKPPLRLHVDVESPGGRHTRWGADEPTPEHVISGLRFSSTMPGGHESADGVLPRKTGRDAPDLESLSTVTIIGPGGDVAWEGRLERSPRSSGNEFSISPSAVGYQAALDDNKSARALIIDRDLSKWQAADIARKLVLNANFAVTDPSTGDNAGIPTVRTSVTGPWVANPGRASCEAWYDAQGLNIGYLVYAWVRGVNVLTANAWTYQAGLATDSAAVSFEDSGNLLATGPGSGVVTATAARKFAYVQLFYGNAAAGDSREYAVDWTPIVIGDHGLTFQSTGYYASDIVDYIVSQFAPELNREIDPTGFVVDHFAELDMTTASDLLTKANRFDLCDWAVWDGPQGPTFYYFPRNSQGRKWRARVAPAQLSEVGPAADRIWESVIVSFTDTDGTTRTVGPPGSGADTEDALLKDSDPENPANKLGITRRSLLQMSTATAAGATQIGARFLDEQKLLDTSGQATLVGHVQDDHGVWHPAWRVRAGDTVSFVDSHDNSERRIVKAEHDYSSRTTSVDLDSPSEGLQALLDRLGVRLVSLGLS